ncbi:hypothetical protein [Microbacterium sp. NPDC091662]|uniref:hypothetical protein n=1 Tax=Microbacterium sp. NPDC091662 TaxID=3364211 RepID=UPI003813F6F4
MSTQLSFSRGTLGLLAVGVLLALSGCTPAPQSTPKPTPSPEASAPAPYDGPVVFVGDELDWFLPDSEEISGLLPDVGEVAAPTPSLIQISDGGGPDPVPAICSTFVYEPSLRSVGARSVTWTSSLPDERDGWLHVLQFADEAAAQALMDQYVDAAQQCAEFTYGGPSTFASTVRESDDGVRAVAGSLVVDDGFGGGNRLYLGYATVGNVVVNFWQPFSGDGAFDSVQAAEFLRDKASDARKQLVEELTANPPEPSETPPAADPAAAWSTWEVTDRGVGPILLGSELEDAIAAVPGAKVIRPEWDGGQTRLVSPDGSASLLLWTDDGGTVVAAVSVGFANVSDEPREDPAALPAAGDVRIGDTVAEAMSAFPGGTSVRIVSSGEYFYDWTTREGALIRFRVDRDAMDPAAVITGILTEDATLRQIPDFG